MTERRVILALVAIFGFGYTFHWLWLIYDAICLGAALHVLGPRVSPELRRLAGWCVVLIVGWCATSAYLHGASWFWALAIWDTLKHVFLWLYLLRGRYEHRATRSFIASDELYRFAGVAFVANAAFALYQAATGEIADNVAGFFGPGATHSFGYFMILYFFLAYQRGERTVRLVAILAIAALVALVSESMGFFILLPLWAVAAVIKSGRATRSLAAGAIAIVVIGGVFAYTQPEFVDSLASRVITVIQPEEPPSPDKPINGRGTATAYAALVGGWTGEGPGTYSLIYGMEGSGAWLLDVVQIDISELSHLLAEWGGLGVGFVIGLFGLLYATLRVQPLKRLLLFALFLATLMHGQLLMDERLIFFEMLTVLCLLDRNPAPPPQRNQDPRDTDREPTGQSHHDEVAPVRA
ncbi:MAG TPA: hypothetical protein VF403_19755 [Kofleriaceae bacterium]